MKLILSRKGFDSALANGGGPSPIFDDGTMCSIPIPDSRSSVAYDDIRWNGGSLGPIVESLTRGRVAASRKAHLDPDLRRDALARAPRWTPIFGQSGAAESHLRNLGVGAGDLFLFFGWFRMAERIGGAIRFARGAPDMHVIWGWMQVAAREPIGDKTASKLPWAANHPHLATGANRARNTLYLATPVLSASAPGRPGAGVFPFFDDALRLTMPGAGRSVWALPRWFHQRGRPPLSYHGRRSRWRVARDALTLRSAYPGQEFVLDLDYYPEAAEWLRGIFIKAAK